MKNNQKWYIVDMDLHKLKVVNYYYFNLENSDSYTPPNEGWSSPETFIGKLPNPIVEETDINTLRQQTNVSRQQFKSVFDEETLKILPKIMIIYTITVNHLFFALVFISYF